MPHRPTHFQPRHLLDVGDSFDTGMGTTKVVTDAGPAYIKVMGNRQGPHNLACEWVGTRLADWFGLPTADYTIMDLQPSDEFPLPRGNRAAPGPAFVTRALDGQVWQKTPDELDALVNIADITRLVIFDNWTLNCDRHPPPSLGRLPNYDNVYLTTEDVPCGRYKLVAIDHNNCFTCGRDLTAHASNIDWIHKDELYGLFPEFAERLNPVTARECADKLRNVTRELATEVVGSIPPQWDVSDAAARALIDLICGRARWLADNILGMLRLAGPPPRE